MSNAELKTILESIEGFSGKVAYRCFNEATPLPFICYLEVNADNFNADNKAYYKRRLVDIELYTEYKDETTERKLEDVLDAHALPYAKTEEYIESENCYMITYTLEV